MNQKRVIVVSTRISERIAKKIDDYIEKEDVFTSRSDVVRLALTQFFEKDIKARREAIRRRREARRA